MTFEEFQSTRYFASLDGLRAISILLVVSLHTTDPLWQPLHGAVGVTVFFVISGFLITTLLLREERGRGNARIGAFYIRRAFRILPLYYVALFAYVVLIFGAHVKAGARDLKLALPYYITYQNDFAPSGSGFGHTWSLAIEEKFYLVWPVLGFLAPRRWRTPIIAALCVATGLAVCWDFTAYFATYFPIVLGCALALLLDRRRGFEAARRLTSTPLVVGLVCASAFAAIWIEDGGHVHLVFSVLCVCAMPGLLFGPAWATRALANRAMVYVGTRSYAVYLIHRMAKGVIDPRFPPGASALSHQLLRLALIFSLSLAGAELLYRAVERPLIQRGRRLAARLDSQGPPANEIHRPA